MADKYLWNIGGADLYLWKVGSKGGGAETELPFGFQAVISQTPEGKESVQLMDFDMIPESVAEKIKEAAKSGKAIAKDDDDHGTPVFVTEEGGHYSVWDQGMYAARLNAQLTTDTVSTLRYDLERVSYDVFYHADGDSVVISGVFGPSTANIFPEGDYASKYDASSDTVSLTWGKSGKSGETLFDGAVLTRVSGAKGSVLGAFALKDDDGETMATVEFTDETCVYWVKASSEMAGGYATYVIDGYSDDGEYVTAAHGFSGVATRWGVVSNMILSNESGTAPESWDTAITLVTGEEITSRRYVCAGVNYGGICGEVDFTSFIFTVPSAYDVDTPPFKASAISRRVTISWWSLKGVAKMAKGGAEYVLGSDGSANAITMSKDGSAQDSVALKTINGNAIVGEGDVEATGVVWVEY